MRPIVMPLAASLLVATSLGVQATEKKKNSAAAIVEKAVKAAGGKETLTKNKAVTWSETGTYYGMGEGVPYTGKYAVQWPDRFRMEIENVFTIVLNGNKGWVKTGDTVTEMDEDQLAEQRERHHAGFVTRLVHLTKDHTLTALGESEFDGRKVQGVKVSHKDHRDVLLYFDKKTHLLARAEWTVKSDEQAGKEVNQVMTFGDYKDVGGEKIAMKVAITHDSKKFVEAELSEVKPLESLPDSVFAKP